MPWWEVKYEEREELVTPGPEIEGVQGCSCPRPVRFLSGEHVRSEGSGTYMVQQHNSLNGRGAGGRSHAEEVTSLEEGVRLGTPAAR